MGEVEALFKSFDVFAAAPNGVAKLRELILQLAVQGKLVPQDPSDEPASELLKKIQVEKAKLVAEKKIKKSKPLPPIDPDEVPFELPEGWEWVRLGGIVSISSGVNLTSKNMVTEGGVPVFGGNGINGHHDKANVHEPTLVIGRVGFYCGSVHVTPKRAWVTDNAFKTRFASDCIDLHFLAWLLRGTDLRRNDSATAQPVISGRKVYPIIVALPPLPEQNRIVAKVDQLMSLCDDLEARYNAQQEERQKLNTAALDTLLAAQDQAEFDAAWQRVCDTFDLLYDAPESVAKLRQAILQLAVMGKLVEQDPDDEPASALLKKIRAEKDRLVAEGKIRKSKPLPPIEPGEVPFEVPEGWKWARVGAVGNIKLGRQRSPKDHTGPYMVPYLRVANVHDDRIDTTDVKEMNFTPKEQEIFRLRYGDVLLNEGQSKELVGRSAIYRNEVPNACFQNTLLRFRVHDGVEPEYSQIYFRICLYNGRFQRAVKQTTNMAHLSASRLIPIEYPLPPLNEQRRIIARTDQLMSRCNDLETTLIGAQTRAESLVSAVVGQFQGDGSNRPISTSAKSAAVDVEKPLKTKPEPESRQIQEALPEPSGVSQRAFLDLDPDEQAEAVFEALWPCGAFPWRVAIKSIADDLRERGLADFQRFRKDGPLGQAIHKAMNLAAKYGYLDRPKRGWVRAVQPDAKLYTGEDWKAISTQALRDVEFDNDEHAIRLCAEWARENCGLEFKRLRRSGSIWNGLADALC